MLDIMNKYDLYNKTTLSGHIIDEYKKKKITKTECILLFEEILTKKELTKEKLNEKIDFFKKIKEK